MKKTVKVPKQHIQQIKRKIWSNRKLLGITDEDFKGWSDAFFGGIDVDELNNFILGLSRPELFFDPSDRSKYTIIYRFSDPNEFTLEPDVSMQLPCYNYKSIDRSTPFHLDVYRQNFTTIQSETNVIPAVYHITSSNANNLISVEDYLSTSYGKGGQYVGFNEYKEETFQLFNWAHLSETYDIFGGKKRFCVISFLEPIINPNLTPNAINSLNPVGYLPPEGSDPFVSLESVVPIEDFVLWYGRLGALMPPKYQNMAEHNFVGDINIPSFVVESHNINCIKTVLSAAYHGYFDEFIN